MVHPLAWYGALLLLGYSLTLSYGQAEKIAPFCSDSAYYFIQQQVDMGARVPNTPAHQLCKRYLKKTLQSFGAQLTVQPFTATTFDGKTITFYNLIASFNPLASKRILLAAHWDTRPFADKDTQQVKEPIQGANDGASGVGVLLEIARLMGTYPLGHTGVDFIFFDGEDYGPPAGYVSSDIAAERQVDFWCLGSQFWAKCPHVPSYKAEWGMVLDMVGHPQATFYKEGWSAHYAAKQVEMIWHTAARLGYTKYFINRPSKNYIIDDHYFVNRFTQIPMVDIIDHSCSQGGCFKPYHHTHMDNIAYIDKQTLQAVGETILAVLRSVDTA